MTMPAFVLPDLLVAERIGRAVVEQHPPAPGRPWIVVAECSLAGAAAVAAARHGHNRDADVTVRLLGPEVETCSEFATLLEAVGCMDLPVGLWKRPRPGALPADALIVLGADLPERGALGVETVPVADLDADDAWDARPAGSDPETLLHRPTDATPVLSVEAVRAVDAAAMEDYGLPGLCLMENAGIGATRVARDLLPGGGRVLVAAGRGNNGGDGLVVARGLLQQGFAVEVALLADPDALDGDAAANRDLLLGADIPLHPCADDPASLRARAAAADLVVDGLLGTGLQGEVREPFRTAIEAINASRTPVLALDIPSGLHGDTGAVLGAAVRAAATVTFAALKHGLVQGDGPAHAGTLTLADIGAPAELIR